MQASTEINNQLKRNRLSDKASVLAVDDQNFFFCEKDKKSAYIGACYMTDPVNGMNDQIYTALISALSMQLPPESIIQFTLLSTNHIDDAVLRYYEDKKLAIQTNPNINQEVKEVLEGALKARVNFLRESKDKPPVERTGVTTRSNRLLMSIKIPQDLKSTDEEYQVSVDSINKVADGLRNSLFPNIRQLVKEEYLAQVRSIIYPFEPLDYSYDPHIEVGKQFFKPTTNTTYKNTDVLKIDDVNYRLLSVKALPTHNNIATMNEIVGESLGLHNQLAVPYMINFTMVTTDVVSKNQSIETMYMQAHDQATPFALRFSPALKKRRDGFEILFQAVKRSEIPVDMTFNIFMFHKDIHRLNRVSTTMANYYKSLHLNMQADTDIILPLLWNAIPLNPSSVSMQNAYRSRMLTVHQAGTFIPIFSDFTGMKTGFSQIYFTRRGSMFGFDPTTTTNTNGMIFGSSGSGKSVFMQNFVNQEFESGALVRIVDEGGSYKKLCELLDGQYIEFTKHSNLCLNPFTNVIDIDDELEQLAILLKQMAAPNEDFDSFLKSSLTAAIKSTFDQNGTNTTIDHIAEYLRLQEDKRLQDLARQLYQFTSSGQFGKWFNGVNNLNLNKQLVVLELEALKPTPHLKTVVMMMLLSRIQFDMMFNRDYKRKYAIFEEVTSYLKDPIVATFIADFYARLRKYDAGTWLVTQSMSSIKNTPAIDDMINNSSTRIYLKQLNPAEVDNMASKNYIPNEPYTIKQIKSLNTFQGEFSEAYILRENEGTIVRVVLSRFFQILYSSKGSERNTIFEAQNSGIPVARAIEEYMVLEKICSSEEQLINAMGRFIDMIKMAVKYSIPTKDAIDKYDELLRKNADNRQQAYILTEEWIMQHGHLVEDNKIGGMDFTKLDLNS